MASRGAVLVLLVALAATAYAGRDHPSRSPLGATMNGDGTLSDTPVPVPVPATPLPATRYVPGATTPSALAEELPALATLVTERKRTFSVGLDPDVEQTAAEWFESLGYRTLTGDTHYTKGFWGGTVTEKDSRMAVSFCTSSSDVSLLSGLDFANWLPVPNVFESLRLDFPDAKFLLFETPVDVWMERIKAKALASQVMGEQCGCVGVGAVRSLDSACGDQLHHYCDVYPCLWERTFATWEVDPLAWKEAYINHMVKVKTSIPSDRLLVIPMLGEQNPVAISKAIGTFLGLTITPDQFAAKHPFEPHLMSFGREHRWSVVFFVMVGIFGLALLFMPNPWAGGLGGYHEYQH